MQNGRDLTTDRLNVSGASLQVGVVNLREGGRDTTGNTRDRLVERHPLVSEDLCRLIGQRPIGGKQGLSIEDGGLVGFAFGAELSREILEVSSDLCLGRRKPFARIARSIDVDAWLTARPFEPHDAPERQPGRPGRATHDRRHAGSAKPPSTRRSSAATASAASSPLACT